MISDSQKNLQFNNQSGQLTNSIQADIEYLSKFGHRVNGYMGEGINTLGTGFAGMWSKEDQALFEVHMAQAQQMNAWSQMEYENWYNSPEQQARRQRIAGLNPDLQGIDNMASASPAGVTPPSGPVGTGVGEVASFVGSVFSAFSTAMNIAQGIQSFRSGLESVRSQKLANLDNLESQAIKFLVDTVPGDWYDENGWLGDNGKNHYNDIETMALKFADDNSMSSRDRKAFVSAVHRQALSPRFNKLAYQERLAVASARTELAQTTASPYYYDSDVSMRLAFQPLIAAKMKALNSTYKYQDSYNEYYSDYWNSMDGRVQGESSNTIVSEQGQKANMEKMMTSARHKMLKSLYDDFKNGNQFSGILLGLLDFGRFLTDKVSGNIGISSLIK